MARNIGVSSFLKTVTKTLLGDRFYRSLYLSERRIRGAYYILKNDLYKVLINRISNSETRIQQKFLVWETPLPYFSSFKELITYFEKKNVEYYEGCYTIYIPPQPGLAEHLGAMPFFYPADAGYKILKDLSDPDNAHYMAVGYKVSWEESTLVGKPVDQLHVASVSEMLNISPRIYDLVGLSTKQNQLTCFVVQHIESSELTISDGLYFKEKLNSVLMNGILGATIPYKGEIHKDFTPPDFNGNLIKDKRSGELHYVDFQNFVLKDQKVLINKILNHSMNNLSFGDVPFLRRNKSYIYQTFPGIGVAGKRDSNIRWEAIKGLLANSGISVQRRLILDICCNSGIISSFALSEGALWALGWDLPQVAHTAEKLQKALGFTRITMKKAILSEDYSLHSDIEPRFLPFLGDAIVFYLAAWRHIGLVKELLKIRWRALVFEGHERESFNDYLPLIKSLENEGNSFLAESISLQDGDTEARQLLLFLRKEP